MLHKFHFKVPENKSRYSQLKFILLLISLILLSNSTFGQIKKEAAEFIYKDKDAHSVSVVGSFNNWNPEAHPLKLIGDEWVGYLALDPGYYYYKFVVDGRWLPDPQNDWKVNDGGDSFNSIILIGDPPRPQRLKNNKPFPKGKLPIPVVEGNPEFVELYYKAWELAWNHLAYGTASNQFEKIYLDEGFDQHIYQWDSAFMTAFAVYSNNVFPVMAALDNFYESQRKDGYIQRVYNESDGSEVNVPTKNEPMINPPLFAWIEWRYYRISGDASRLRKVLPVLVKYFNWIDKNLHDNLGLGLYYNTPLGSGMDNIPRPGVGKGVWVDMSAQQALTALCIVKISEKINRRDISASFRQKYNAIKGAILGNCWNWDDNFFYDVKQNGELSPVKHIGAYWTMISGVCPENQSELFFEHLLNPNEFHRRHLFPALSADDPAFDPKGHYWRGGVWAPTNFMTIKGLEKYGADKLAYIASENHIKNIWTVYNNPPIDEDKIAFEQLYGDGYKTIWECHSPDYDLPGTRWDNTFFSRQDFVGWSGLGPIALLIENVIGLRINGSKNEITWVIERIDRIGIKRLKFNGQFVTLISEEADGIRSFNIKCQKPFKLNIKWKGKTFTPELNPGTNSFEMKAE